MHNADHELERYLSEFQPRALHPLEMRVPSRHWTARWAAAAIVVLSAATGLWYAHHSVSALPTTNSSAAQPPTSLIHATPNAIELTKLALDNETQFEAQLAIESRTVLPDFSSPQSTLRVFAKE